MPARADVLYEQPVFLCDNSAIGFLPSDLSLEFSPGSFQVAGGFMLDTAVALEDVGAQTPDDFPVRPFSGTLDSPALFGELTPDAVSGAAAGSSVHVSGDQELDVWAYNFQPNDPRMLESDMPYPISIHNNAAGSADWTWVSGAGPSNHLGTRISGADEWSNVPVSDVGSGSGTVVPEPATITLLALGLAAYLFKRRRGGHVM